MKKILFSLITFICALAIGLGIYSTQKTTFESELMLQNIEALGRIEGGMVIWCALHFEACDRGWPSVNCAFCDWNLTGYHSGSDSCYMN